MRVTIDQDEWYPVRSVVDKEPSKYTEVGELTDEEMARVTAAFAEFGAVQSLLSASICRVAGHEPREYRRRIIDGKSVAHEWVCCEVCSVELSSGDVSP